VTKARRKIVIVPPGGNPYPLGISSIDQYAKAVIDLYSDQKASSVGVVLQELTGQIPWSLNKLNEEFTKEQ
jgi:hypothetical protein